MRGSELKRKGFTLTELLVSVTIVAVVAAIGYVTYGNTQVAARDARRKQDLASLKVALEVFRNANKRYPCPGAGENSWQYSFSKPGTWINDDAYNTDSCNNATTKISFTPTFINKIPDDPKNTADTFWATTENYSFGYRGYYAGCPTKYKGQFYILGVRLENKSDKDRNELRQVKDCTGTPLVSSMDGSTGWNYSYVITSEE